jgi:hypothetical protein
MIYQDEQKIDLSNCTVAMKVEEHIALLTIPISIITSILHTTMHFVKQACHALPITSVLQIIF